MEENEKPRNHSGHYRNRRRPSSGKPQNGGKGEPHPNFDSCAKLEMTVEEKNTEYAIASAAGVAWNKYAWFGEKEAAMEPGAPEYEEVCEKTDEWFAEFNKLLLRLKTALGFAVDATFALPELEEVMNRNGYENVNGIWKKSK